MAVRIPRDRLALTRALVWSLACFCCLALPSVTLAQNEEPMIPAPEEIDLTTGDGVLLKATYYPGMTGKDTVPVVLLHSYKGSRADFEPLAVGLQSLGHAVVLPDLRGHGKSTQMRRAGRLIKVEHTQLRPADFLNMIKFDMEAIKSFLMERNNAGELNIEKLCVVGAEMGASVAMNWTMTDWSWPQLPTIKQGRDVKAVVLISPEWSYRGMRMNDALSNGALQSSLSMLIVVGNQSGRHMKDAKRIFSLVERFHPMPEESERAEKQTLFLMDNLQTSLQGEQLVNERSLGVPQTIAQFIQLRLVAKDYPWTDRTSPLK